MNANEPYKIILYILNKNQAGDLTPDEYNRIINEASLEYCAWLMGEFQQYRYQSPVARVQFGENRNIRQSLTPLIYRYVLGERPDGTWPYPGDFQGIDAMWDIYRFKEIRYIQQQYLHSVLNSVIDPVVTNPIYLIEDAGFRFYPNTNFNSATLENSQALLSYVRTPPRIVWAYTLDINGLPVYDPIHSIAPIWLEKDMIMIITRALTMIGVNLQEGQVTQYAQDILKNGA